MSARTPRSRFAADSTLNPSPERRATENSRVARRKDAGGRRWQSGCARHTVAVSVTTTRPLRMTLELELDSDPIRGVLEDGHRSRPFDGWLALTQALEDALRSARSNEDARE
jgi:hypothetical protein